jgi:hypothetical protein
MERHTGDIDWPASIKYRRSGNVMSMIAGTGTITSNYVFDITDFKTHLVSKSIQHLCHDTLRVHVCQTTCTFFTTTPGRPNPINNPSFTHFHVLIS